MTLHRKSFALSLILLMALESRGQQDKPTADSIRLMLNYQESDGRNRLVALGDKAFAGYLAVLKDETSSVRQIRNALNIVCDIDSDRKAFLGTAVSLLSHADAGVRRNAAKLVGVVGSKTDTAPLVALLYDDNVTVIYAASVALSKIGSANDIVAIDIWMSQKRFNKKEINETILNARKEILSRLEKEKQK